MISPLKDTKALIISGAVTSGKSLLAKDLEKELKLKVISETTTGNYYKILDSINPYLYPNAIYEHCWIYKKYFMFKHLYEKNFLVTLLIAPTLLQNNYAARVRQSTKGDFVKIDPIKQQEEIILDINRLTTNFEDERNKILIISVNAIEDYITAKETIIRAFSNL